MLASGALMGFLPAICRKLLGEELAMPSVATWWCGEKPALEYVRENFDDLVIKPAYPSQRMDPVFGYELKGAARVEMLQRIEARPHAYVAQEMVELSQAPGWSRSHERRLLARPVGLRAYAVTTPDGYSVMPGGLARVATGANARIISMQRGGSSKDAWVLAQGPVSEFTMLTPSLGVREIVRAGANLTSRVVENLFWLGRYSERFDDSARMLRVALSRLVEAGGEKTPAVESALELALRLHILPAPEEDDEIRAGSEHALLEAIYDPEQPGSLAGTIRNVMWSATHVRERLSLDHWHSLNRLQREQQAALKRHPTLTEAIAFLDRVLGVSSSLTGFAMDNMTRDDGWRFLIIGRRLERLSFLAQALANFLRMPLNAWPRRAGVAARTGRFDHYLPFALFAPSGTAAGPRPAGFRRQQPARRGFPGQCAGPLPRADDARTRCVQRRPDERCAQAPARFRSRSLRTPAVQPVPQLLVL